MQDHREQLLALLAETRSLLALPYNDFSWSGWDNETEALEEIDAWIERLHSDPSARIAGMAILFAPTGPIQEVSLSSGWEETFLLLADRFDALCRDEARS